MFNVYGPANSETEVKGKFICDMSGSSIAEFAGAIRTIEGDAAIAGVWITYRDQELYIERAA